MAGNALGTTSPVPEAWLHERMAPALENRGLVSMGWEAGSAYRFKVSVNVKVLDFVKRGGPTFPLPKALSHWAN